MLRLLIVDDWHLPSNYDLFFLDLVGSVSRCRPLHHFFIGGLIVHAGNGYRHSLIIVLIPQLKVKTVFDEAMRYAVRLKFVIVFYYWLPIAMQY